uniref:Putative metallopeptidase 1 n=1 Tax=Rhipicephalus microplus TaxID=6941 RepID=A0A6G5A9G0_RHIMP
MMKSTHLCALFLICAYAACGEEMQNEERQEEVIRLGIYYVYDNAFSDRALFILNESYNAYFAALTRAAQEFFKLHQDPKILLTLVGSSQLKEEGIVTNTTTMEKKLNASDTLEKLGAIMTWHNNTLYADADVIFLVTGLQLDIKESWRTGEWYGLSYRRSICFGNSTVGIIHDDGANFNGVRQTALQIALMLGASKDNGRWGECRKNEEEEYLTSNLKGGRIPYLSECSRESVRSFYYRVKGDHDICWNDKPKPALDQEIGFPKDFYKLFHCDHCHVAEHFRNKTTKPINCLLSTINRNINNWPSTTESDWARKARKRYERWYRKHTTTVSPYHACTQECCRFMRYRDRRGGWWDCWTLVPLMAQCVTRHGCA